MKSCFQFLCICLFSLPLAAQDTHPLSQTYTSSQGTLTLSYPEGWIIDEMSSTITLTNEPLVGDREAVGWIGIIVNAPQHIPGVRTSGDLLRGLRTLTEKQNAQYTMLSALTLNAQPAGRADGCSEEGVCQTYFSFIVAPETVASALVIYRPGSSPWDEAIIYTILESIRYNPPEARATGAPTPFVSADGRMAFSYPAGWIVAEEQGFIRITNTDKFTGSPGEVLIQFTAYPLADDLTLPPDASAVDALYAFVQNTGRTNFGSAVGVRIGDQLAARIHADSGQVTQTVYALITDEDVLVYASMLTASGEQLQFEPALRTLLGSLHYSLPLKHSAQELEAVAIDQEALGSRYEMTSAGIAFRHPVGWLVEAQGAYVIVATDDSFAQTGPVSPDQLAMIIDLITPERWAGLDNTPTFAEVFRIIPFEHSNTFTEFLLDGRPAAYSMRQSSHGYDIGLLVVQLSADSFGVIYAIAVGGALEQYKPAIFSIAASIELAVAESDP